MGFDFFKVCKIEGMSVIHTVVEVVSDTGIIYVKASGVNNVEVFSYEEFWKIYEKMEEE